MALDMDTHRRVAPPGASNSSTLRWPPTRCAPRTSEKFSRAGNGYFGVTGSTGPRFRYRRARLRLTRASVSGGGLALENPAWSMPQRDCPRDPSVARPRTIPHESWWRYRCYVRVAGAGRDRDAVPIQDPSSVEDSVPRASSSVTPSPTEVRRGQDQVWRRTRGPIFATVVVSAAYLLTRTSIPIPDLTPVYLVVVAGIAAVDGSRSGTTSGLIMVAYVAYADSAPAHPFTYSRDNLLRLG